MILAIPLSRHKEIREQTLSNITHYKSCNIINFGCVFLKIEKEQNHSALTMTFVAVGEETTLFHMFFAFLINSAINIIKKARRAKKEVGKRN